MPVTINGDGSITGYTPTIADGSITAAKLASGAITSSALPSGSVIQTVSQTFAPYGDSGSDRGGSTTYSDTGIVLSITPTVSTSKIMVLSEGCSFGYKSSDSQVDYYMRLAGTPSGGSLTEFREIEVRMTNMGNTTQRLFDSWSMSYLHDHNGTVAIEYKVQHKTATAEYAWARYRGATVTLMEIAV
jgi:hypothetical protein